MEQPKKLNFMRITVLGQSGCGKTSLITAFVNNTVPSRHFTTNSTNLYYKKMEVLDEGEFDVIKRPILVEIEDTPGSERGPDGASLKEDSESEEDDGGPPKIKKGSRVELKGPKHRNEVLASFNSEKWRLKLEYKKMMDGMLGKEFTVKLVARDTSIGLPSPDGSEGGIWNFPPDCVKLKITPELPIDKYLDMRRTEPTLHTDPQKRKEQEHALKKPVSFFSRPAGPATIDKAVTPNRMGFFICYDLSEEDSETLKEAMHVYDALKKDLANKAKFHVQKPVIMFLGLKGDKTVNYEAVEANFTSATIFCESNDIRNMRCSAMRNDGVSSAFTEIIDAISQSEPLWTLQGISDSAGDEDDSGGGFCVLQ